MPTRSESDGAPAGIRPRKFRIGERLEARQNFGAAPLLTVLTDEDRDNLAAFDVLVTRAIEILKQEIAAVNAGNFDQISSQFDAKSTVLKSIELKMPLVQPFIQSSYAEERNLLKKLQELTEVAGKDSALLERMALAAGTIVKEIKRATERHSLNGLYGNSGRKLSETSEGRLKIDKSL